MSEPLPGLPGGKPLDPHAVAREAAVRAANVGKLIESGWLGLRAAWISDEAPQIQVEEMRNAFYAGAHHLFTAQMLIHDDGTEETDADLARMDKIDGELREFYADFERRRLNRPTLLMAAAVNGMKRPQLAAIESVDRALRQLSADQGNFLSPRDVVTVLTFPMTRMVTHGTEEEARAAVEVLGLAVGALQKVVDEKHGPKKETPNG